MNSQIKKDMTVYKKNKPFKVPDGYFEKFPDKVLYQLNELPSSKNETKPLLIFKRQLLIAASFIGFFLLSYGIYKIVTYSVNGYENKIVNQSSYEEVLLAKVDEYDIINSLIVEEDQNVIESEVIENYLIDEEIKEQTINENIKP